MVEKEKRLLVYAQGQSLIIGWSEGPTQPWVCKGNLK